MQEFLKKLCKWFADNCIKSNSDKCHLTVTTNDIAKTQIAKFSTKKSSSEKFLGVNIDSKLHFDSQVNDLFSKTSKKQGSCQSYA